MSVSDKKFNKMMTHYKMLETQITQLANTLKDCDSPSSLPSQGVNPKKPVYSITTRSGKVFEKRVSRISEEDENNSDSSDEKEKDVSKSVRKEEVHEKKKSVERVQEEEVHLSILLTEAMTQMPRYSKFLKDILRVKRECNEIDSVELGECCSALIHNDLPKKMKDPGNFSFPCKIKSKLFENALCDLGASVSIMPYSLFKNLKLEELLPTNMTLQLADRSIKFPKGRVEDVPLKIGGFTIPIDFIVLEIEEDDHIPIILGRPFLTTSRALIDVKGGRTTFRVGNEKESFKLKPMHESLSFVKGTMNNNSLRSLDTVCVINSSTNGVHEIFDDVLVRLDCMKVSEEKKELPKAMDEEVIDIPHWFELCPQEEDDGSKEVDGVKPSTRRNKAKKKSRASRKKRMRLKLKHEKVIFEVQENEVSSSNNEELLKIEENLYLSPL
ncbi:uncharacterized protein LOC110681584 [Chenopodium quinoa]|uniref:uncharacterized protein LOC110681584 n=1 Tax=Chenopodium quinoa TaxID=63459 RepID=UPI000B76E68F|nr:uncharacterized protein LOC110681584 [Chenopodium quinoa]